MLEKSKVLLHKAYKWLTGHLPTLDRLNPAIQAFSCEVLLFYPDDAASPCRNWEKYKKKGG